MKVLQSSENLSSDIDCDQSRVQPLLLDGNCFFKKISQLDHPLIDKLNLNNMNKDFCEYWNYFASDDKKRQHVLRQLIEPKTNFVHNAKDKRAASFLKQTARDENKVSALPAEKAESIIFDEFISCFRDGQSKANVTAKRRDVAPATATEPVPYTGYQSEKHNIIKQIKMCRNPYEIEFYKQKLRRLKELEQRRCEASERLFRQKQSDEQAVNATPLGRAQNTMTKNVIKYQKPQDHMQKKAKTKSNVIMQKYNPWNANDAVMPSALDKNANINMNNTKFSSSKSKDYAYTTNYQEQLQAYEAKLLNMQTKNQRKHINKDEKAIEGSAGKVKQQQNIPFLSTDNYAHIIKKKQIFDRADNLPYVFTKEKLFDNDCKETASTSNDISHFSRRQRKSKENKRKHQIRESRRKTTRDDANAIPHPSRSNASGTQQYRTDLQALQNYEQKLKKLKKLMKHKKREINAMIADKDEQREIKRNMKKEYKANLQLLKGFEQKITELKITNKENKQSKRKSIHVDGIEELNKHFKKLSKYSIESRSKAIASSEKYKRKSLRNRLNSKNNNEEKKPEEDLVKQSSETTIKFHESDTRNNFKPKQKTKKNRLEIEKIIQKWNEIESKTIAQKSQKLGKQNQTERHLQNRIRYEKFLAMLRNISEKLRNHKMHEVMKLIKNLKKLLEDEQKTGESLIDINDLQQLKYRVENVLYLKRSERNKSKLQKQSLDKIIQLKTKSYSKYSNSAKYFASVKKNQMPKERFSDYSTTSTIIFLGQQKKNSILQESKQGQSQSQSLQNESSLISLAAAFSNSYRVSNNRELTANTAEALLPQELQNFLIEQRERNSFDDNIELDATNSTETDNQSEESQETNEKHQIYTFMSMSKVVVYKNPYASQKSIDEITPNDSQSKTSNVNETNTKGSMLDEHWPMAKVQVPFVAPIPKITLQNLIRKFEEHKQAKSLEQCATADVKKPLSLKHVLNRSYSLDELPKQIHPKMPKRTSLSTQNLSNDIAPSQRSNRSKQNLIMPQLQLENAIGNESEIGNPIKPAQLTQPNMYEMLRRLKTLELRICYAQMMMHSSNTAPEQHEPASLSICEN